MSYICYCKLLLLEELECERNNRFVNRKKRLIHFIFADLCCRSRAKSQPSRVLTCTKASFQSMPRAEKRKEYTLLWMDELHFASPDKPRKDSIPLQIPTNNGLNPTVLQSGAKWISGHPRRKKKESSSKGTACMNQGSGCIIHLNIATCCIAGIQLYFGTPQKPAMSQMGGQNVSILVFGADGLWLRSGRSGGSPGAPRHPPPPLLASSASACTSRSHLSDVRNPSEKSEYRQKRRSRNPGVLRRSLGQPSPPFL